MMADFDARATAAAYAGNWKELCLLRRLGAPFGAGVTAAAARVSLAWCRRVHHQLSAPLSSAAAEMFLSDCCGRNWRAALWVASRGALLSADAALGLIAAAFARSSPRPAELTEWVLRWAAETGRTFTDWETVRLPHRCLPWLFQHGLLPRRPSLYLTAVCCRDPRDARARICALAGAGVPVRPGARALAAAHAAVPASARRRAPWSRVPHFVRELESRL